MKKRIRKKAAMKVKKAKIPESKSAVEVTVKKKVLGKAPEEYHFTLKSGEKLKSVYDLIDALEKMGEDTFSHHVSGIKNDFSTWIEDVFDEKKWADEIRSITDKMETQRKLMRNMIDELLK